MSSVLIKGMEMPKNCAYCPLSEYRNSSILDCKQIGTVGTAFRDNNVLKRRHPNCPLIELPPHGRLVDLDKMVDEYWDGSSMRIGKTDIKDIEEYDTVIEAEGSE